MSNCGVRSADCGIDEPEDAKARSWSFLLLICGLLLTSSASFAAEPSSVPAKEEIVRSIEGHYRELADLTAQVTQKNRLKALGKTQVFEGNLSIKKPGRLRIDYTTGPAGGLRKTAWSIWPSNMPSLGRPMNALAG